MSISLCSKTKKKECSCLRNAGRTFFTQGGAPLWYSNRSPSTRRTTEAHPLILAVIILLHSRYSELPAHENRDRLPSFAVNLDEDPTDIFGAVCALLVFSALLKNCNNYLLDNKPSYDHVSNGRNTVSFEVILLQTQQRSNWLDEIWC